MITYKGFVGTFVFDETTNLFHGKVSNSHYPITFQGKSIQSTKEAFEDSIDEYIEWCKKYGKDPESSSVEE
jgi:predicted HicB family RNase H-like nuclease